MPNTLRVKRGLAATLPNGASGEPLFTTDTYELYIGKGDGTNQRYQKYIASGTTSQYLRGDGSLETHNLDSLTDVVVSSPSNGQFLKYNGTNWVNSAGGFLSGGATAPGQVGVFDATTNIVGYTTFTYDTVTDKLSMTNGYVNNTLTVDGQLVIKSESGASAYTRGLKFPDNSYGGTGDIAGLRLHNAGGENIILELYAGNDSLDTINFAVAAGGSTYNDNVTINGNKIWNAGNLPSPLSSTGTINSGEIPIFSNSTTVYSDTALFWDNSLNRLGVGGTSPNAQVGVSTSSGVNAFGYRTSGANYYELVLVYDNTTYGHTFQANRGSSTSARNITFLNGSNTVSIDESGNMGIGLIVPNPGTSGPGGLGLDIYASTTAALALHNATSGTGISAGGRIYYNSTNMTIRNLSTGNMTMTVDNGNFTVITLGAENIKVEGSTGKVGIGAPASIAEMLTVNGSIQQSGVTSSMLKANASGKIIAAVSNTDFQAPITLTTTGTSGAATFNGTTLNIPQYQAVLTNPVTGSGTNNEIAYFNATGSTIASLSTATYPSLTELSYVKGVTSSIQTQLNGKQNTLTNPVTGTGTSGYHAKFTVTGSTIGNSLIYDNGIRAISIGNSSTNSWGSPFYVIEGGSYGGFLGFQTNAADVKFGVGAYWNGSNYVYTNTNIGFGLFNIGGDSTNGYLDFYGAPASTPGLTATPTKKFGIDNAGNGHFVESIGVGFTSGTPNGRIDFRNPANAIIVGKNTVGGTNTYSSIRLTTANSGGVGDSIGEIRGLSTNSSNRDIALTFLTTEGSGSQTEKLRIAATGAATFSSSISATSATFSTNQNSDTIVSVSNTTAGSGSQAYFQATSDTTAGYTSFGKTSSSFTAYKILTSSSGYIYNSKGDIAILNDNATGTIKMAAGGSTSAHLTISSTGAATFSSSVTANGISSIGQEQAITFQRTTGTASDVYSFNADSGSAYLYNNTTAKPLMVWAEGGNVGIGTTSPATRLEVSSSDLNNIFVTNPDTTGATTGSGIGFKAYNGTSVTQSAGIILTANTWSFGTYSANQLSIGSDGTGGLALRSANAAPITFFTGGSTAGLSTERMRITSGGDLNFNPNNATAYININQGNGLDGGILFQRNNSNKYQLALTGGDALYIYNYATGSESMRITSGGAILVNTSSVGGKLYVYNPATNFQTNTIKGHDANASTTTDGIIVAVAERNTTNNTFYALGYYNNGAGAWRFRVADSGNVTNTNNSYGPISDIKLKENITNASPKLDDLLKVRIVNYNLKSELGFDSSKQIGVIAQELEQIFPGLVDEHKDIDKNGNDLGTKTKSVKMSVFVPILIKAIQEQQAQIEELKSKLN